MKRILCKHWLVWSLLLLFVLSPVTIDLSKGFFAPQDAVAKGGGGNGGGGNGGGGNGSGGNGSGGNGSGDGSGVQHQHQHQQQYQYQYDAVKDGTQERTRSRDRIHVEEPQVVESAVGTPES